MGYAEIVMFAIQGGLRLYGATRKAYADSVLGTALILPLPRAPGVKADTAENWFLTQEPGKKIAKESARISWLLGLSARDAAQDAELVDLYRFYWSQSHPDNAQADDVRGSLSNIEMSAFLQVRQWSDSQAAGMATPLQTIAGTLVNIAVDYFVQTPGAVSEERPEGRALKAFLEGLDATDFATVPPRDLASGLMLAVLQSVSAHPDVLSGGENEQRFITNISKSIAETATGFLEGASDKERREAGVWLQLVGRAVLSGAAETVLADPGRYFKVKPGEESAVVAEVGRTITDLLLGERKLEFRRLFSAEGLDKVVKSALAAVAKNPGLLKVDNKGVENVIVALAGELAKVEKRLSADLFPEVVRLVLDKSADNLDLIWGTSFTSPQRHLLVTATSALLATVAKAPPPGSTWKPRFTPEQLLDVFEAVLDEVVDNPAWLIDEAGKASGTLQAAVEAILAALRRIPANRVSAETGIAILQAGITAVALRVDLLDDLPAAAGQPARAAITAALDAVFGEIFAEGVGAKENWHLARNSVLEALVEIALEKLAKLGATEAKIEELRQVVQELLSSANPFDDAAFATLLEKRLAQAA